MSRIDPPLLRWEGISYQSVCLSDHVDNMWAVGLQRVYSSTTGTKQAGNKEIKEYESLITCVCTDSMRACFTVCWHALRRHSNFRDVWLALVCLWCGFRCSKCWKATLAGCLLLPSARTGRQLCLALGTNLFASGAPNLARWLIDQRRACHCLCVLSLLND